MFVFVRLCCPRSIFEEIRNLHFIPLLALKNNNLRALILLTGNSTTEPILVHYSSLPVSDPNDVISAAEFPDLYSWIAITNTTSNASIAMNTLCASTATHLTDYLCPPLASAVPIGGRMTPTSCAKMWSPLVSWFYVIFKLGNIQFI